MWPVDTKHEATFLTMWPLKTFEFETPASQSLRNPSPNMRELKNNPEGSLWMFERFPAYNLYNTFLI